LYRSKRVEKYYGDLDEHYAKDSLKSVIQALLYSTDDQKHNRPNPSKIPFDGDIRTNLQSYRNAIEWYKRFRDDLGVEANVPDMGSVSVKVSPKMDEDSGQRIGLERDLQAALRININQLDPGLTVVDKGAERSVDSGYIDITARDPSGATVVIELKAGLAGQRAVAQILSYMGDVAGEDEHNHVRGILVASDFDAKAKAAARMVPTLILRKYNVQFSFSDGCA
jgi:hypothetical protein